MNITGHPGFGDEKKRKGDWIFGVRNMSALKPKSPKQV